MGNKILSGDKKTQINVDLLEQGSYILIIYIGGLDESVSKKFMKI